MERPSPASSRQRPEERKRRKRVNRPQASADDRRFVPGALRQWRMVHGLSTVEAQVRIGLSPKSSTWRDWEDERNAPPYKVLLQILAATGMIGAGQRTVLEASPGLRLEAARAAHRAAVRRR